MAEELKSGYVHYYSRYGERKHQVYPDIAGLLTAIYWMHESEIGYTYAVEDLTNARKITVEGPADLTLIQPATMWVEKGIMPELWPLTTK